MMHVHAFLNDESQRSAWCRFGPVGQVVYLRRGVFGIDLANMEGPSTEWEIIGAFLDAIETLVPLRIEFNMDPECIGHLMLRPGWRLWKDDHERGAPSFVNQLWPKG